MPSLVRDKRGMFYIVHSLDGKRQWRSTRTRIRSEAFKLFLKATSPQPSPQKQNPVKTLSYFIQDYLRHVNANHGAKTHQIYALALQHFLNHAGDIAVEAITPRVIDMFKVARLERASAATVNNNLRAVRTFFNCLKRWDILQKNPCDGIAQIRLPDQTPPFLSTEQLQHLVGTMNDQWMKPIVIFAAMTGTRLGEILNLTWDKIDLKNRVVLIQSSVSYQVKGGKVRAIPLNETALEVLSSLAGDREGLVFRGRLGGRANSNHVSATFRKTVRRTHLDKRLHFHSLRHTFASLLVQNGVSLFHVQKLLGHSSSRVTEMYAHLQNPRLHDVVRTIDLPVTTEEIRTGTA